ncbi:MAG: Nif3-like dinuclear metal center hexameric protein [Sedimentisphaerales bacterium]
MKTKIIRNTVRPVILASLVTGVVLFCLDAVNASMKVEVKNNVNVLTAQQIVDKIKQHVTCPWQERTVDTFKAGDPDTPVTAVAVTFMATYDVLKQATQQGCNFIITHEPTFYHGQDDTSQLDPDPVIEAKRKFIKDNNLTIWRFHDHIHRTEPDGIVAGMVELFGWKSFQKQNEKLHFELPKPISLQQFVNSLKGKFANSVIRIIGDPRMQFAKFGFSPGASGSIMQMKMLQGRDIEVLIAGETREWETVEYVRDVKDMGRNKALILLGHCISEEAGMKHCSEWLKSFVNEVPIKFIPAGDPFWTP